MTTIGSNHFLDKLEKLPGEEVVWEGGASMLGMVIQLLHTFAAILIVIVFLAIPLGLPNVLLVENPNYVQQTQKAAETKSTDNKNKTDAVKHKPEPKLIMNEKLLAIVIVTGTLLLLSFIFGSMWLRIKNYWFVVTNERICIQSGILTHTTIAIDIDKVVSVISSHSILERWLGLHSIEIVHSGLYPLRVQQGLLLFNPYKIQYVPTSTGLASKLLNNWLPRDNSKRSD